MFDIIMVTYSFSPHIRIILEIDKCENKEVIIHFIIIFITEI